MVCFYLDRVAFVFILTGRADLLTHYYHSQGGICDTLSVRLEFLWRPGQHHVGVPYSLHLGRTGGGGIIKKGRHRYT